jgi:hypothetical protein
VVGAILVGVVVGAVRGVGVGARVGCGVAGGSVDGTVVDADGDALTGVSEGWYVGCATGVDVVGVAVVSHGQPLKALLSMWRTESGMTVIISHCRTGERNSPEMITPT